MGDRVLSRISALGHKSDIGAQPEPPRTVLVVDDEDGVRGFVERVLKSAGYSTVAAASGPDALRAAAAIDMLDMVVTDVMMPEMSGCELVRQLRRSNPVMKVLYVTGYRDRLFDEKVMMWEDEAFIDKPCSIKALLEAVSLLWYHRLDGAPNLSLSIELEGSRKGSRPFMYLVRGTARRDGRRLDS